MMGVQQLLGSEPSMLDRSTGAESAAHFMQGLGSSWACMCAHAVQRFTVPTACPCCRDIKTLVLDEADEMLSKGFKEQIYDVYRYLPPETQVRARQGKGRVVMALNCCSQFSCGIMLCMRPVSSFLAGVWGFGQ